MSTHSQWMEQLPDAFHTWLNGRRVDDVECVIADIAGTSRGKAMPARKFARGDAMYLPTSIFYQTITGDYVDLEDMPDQWTESDLVLVPDFSAATAVPWSADVTLQVVHDVHNQNGSPVSMAPRNVLKRIIGEYAKHGWKPVVAPELEFYLTKPNIDPNLPVEPPIGRTGRQGIARQAYSMSAVEEYGTVIDDIYDFAEAQGFEIDTIIQEGGAGQIEINLMHGDPVELADQVFFYKRLIREAALKNGCFATFMAKPMEEQPGSAMHIHQSVVSSSDGKNIFNNDKDEPTDLFYGFIAGQQALTPDVICILAPYVNSYRRFRRDDSAPINLEWGIDNRTTGIRIPLSNPASRRVENRVVGMDCNPYLAIAASLACGLTGMVNKMTPRESIKGDAYSLPHDLPRDLSVALELFSANPALEKLLGEEFCKLYRTVKHQESAAFLQVISPWEREHLLLNV
ncbi:MAG: glutamine synthetase family protein [Granulosicoccus sp.]